jgi:hypothetical protein
MNGGIENPQNDNMGDKWVDLFTSIKINICGLYIGKKIDWLGNLY